MGNDPFFLDTSAWIIMLNRREDLHAQASRIWRDLARVRRPVVFTDLIVAETGNGLARTPARKQLAAAVRLILSSPRARLVSTTPDALDAALRLYDERPDKTWGLVDCVSFNLMRDQGITDAFTTDQHFEQAGFKCLLPVG